MLAAVSAVVICTDQATKWVAWRELDGTVLNEGGYILLGPAIRAWFARPAIGAAANLVGLVLVAASTAWVLRRRRAASVVVGTGLVAAGWTSNLLDRFGLHEWTAPGTGRGVVDFIPSGGSSRCNVADVWIALGLLVLAYPIGRRRVAGPHPNHRPE
jgi:lipoprotein signal peptidase